MRAFVALPFLWGALACGPSFDDHTVPRIDSPSTYDALATTEHGRSATKFIITEFGLAGQQIRYLDGRTFQLHDEWYWFRLLNGQPIPGRQDFQPEKGRRFNTVAEIVEWAKTQPRLPVGLQWADGARLYSPLFYELALSRRPRSLGLGTLLHVTAQGPRPERWAFDLEFTDVLSHAELVTFFEAVMGSVPATLKNDIYWLVRSPSQEQLAKTMETQSLRFHDRIVRAKDLTVPGETEVYSPGLAAGRVIRVRSGQSLSQARSSDLLVLEDVPDYLPPAAGVITAIPQTPLAHFNLLARNRGIPNGYSAGILDDAEVDTLAYYHAPAVLHGVAPNKLLLKPISEAQFRAWEQLQSKPPVSVTPVDVSTLPFTYDLMGMTLADREVVVRAAGGKAAGYLGLITGAPAATPGKVLAISIRAYAEHVAPLLPTIRQLLADPTFSGQSRARFLALEGEAAYRKQFTAATDVGFADQVLQSGSVVATVARSGGLKQQLRDRPIDSATQTQLKDTLSTYFAAYAPSQGLRFRSSSTAEDVEGFNGAGLYDSNTGYLNPASAPDPADRTHDVAWALKKTWASYWSFEAFEERKLENVEHLSGNMGVVVHARFDDDKERSNGVFLFTLTPGGASMELNVQHGALSVTNPTNTALPEIDRVSVTTANTTPRIERLRPSTVAGAPQPLLSDAELLETFARARAVADAWFAQVNQSRPAAQRSWSLLLDFEFRYVGAGWPALSAGEPLPSRIVLKQARTLEPSFRQLSPEARALPLPHDVLTHARRLERRTCTSAALKLTVVEAYTDALVAPDLGHSVEPFTAQIAVEFVEAAAPLGQDAGAKVDLTHLNLSQVTHTQLGAAGWHLRANLTSEAATAARFNSVDLSADGTFKLSGAGVYEGAGLNCRLELLFSTPNEFLLSLL